MPHGDVVPIEFQRISSYANHSFRIRDAWWRPYRFHWAPSGQPKEIPKAAFCRVESEGEWLDVLFPEAADPGICEAVLLLAAALDANTRPAKYLSSYRALESLAVRAPIEMKAIRHSLAHATTQLSDPNVTKALRSMFGSVSINFRRYPHKRVFYRWLGELLVMLDSALAEKLLKRRRCWLSVDKHGLLAPYEEEALGLDRV